MITKNKLIKPELLIPAGTLRKLQVALAYGADAVYVGAEGFSMRPDGASFSNDDLRQAVSMVHDQNKKIYVAVNSLMMQNEIYALQSWIEETRNINFDAIIISDPAMLMLLKEMRPDVDIHISTQMSTANSLAAMFWKNAGAKRIVLARECSLHDAKQITSDCDIEVEIFIHGAMCVAVSGRCLLSAYMTGNSASRGECKNSCRWEWELSEAKRPGESFPIIETEKNTIILSSTDLCLLEHIPEVLNSGAASLKVEGRMKSEYYVAAVTQAYRAAIDSYYADPENYQCKREWIDDVNSIRHHPYSTGFAYGYPSESPETLQAPQPELGTHQFVGIINQKISGNIYQLDVKYPFAEGETLLWMAPNEQSGQITINTIKGPKGNNITQAHPGTTVEINIEENIDLPPLSILRSRRAIKDVSALT